MKLKFIVAALCLTSGLTLFAQNNQNTTKERAPRQFPSEKMVKELNLSDSQVKELKKLQEDRQANFEKKRAEMESKRQERRQEMDKERTEYQTKLKSVLTPEQYQKYESLQKDRQSKKDGKKDGRKGNRKDGKRTPMNKVKSDSLMTK